jgi:hypothetical protein
LVFDDGVPFEGDARRISVGNVGSFLFKSRLKLSSATAALGHLGFVLAALSL